MLHFQRPETLQAATSSLFAPLRVNARGDKPFHAEVADGSVGAIAVAKIVVTPAQVLRQPRLIRSADRELVKVTLHRRGHLIVAQDGRQSLLRPGDLIAYETTRPYELVGRDSCDIVVLGVPRPMLGPSSDLISRRTAITLPSDHGIRSVIAAFFTGLADHADGLNGPCAVRLADTVASLLITAFTDISADRVELPTGLADRILSYALASLHDPGLSAGSVARRHGISPRYLHRLMQDRGIQFGAWVRRERMKRIRQDLLDPRLVNWTVAAIAARWGIQDPDHLSRSLRAEFGYSAAEIRASAHAEPASRAGSGGADLRLCHLRWRHWQTSFVILLVCRLPTESTILFLTGGAFRTGHGKRRSALLGISSQVREGVQVLGSHDARDP